MAPTARWRIARRVAADRVISTVDPQARHTRKSPEARRDGYRAHVEVEADATLITQGTLTQAGGEDNTNAAVAARMLAEATEPVEAYGDSAYGTGELRAQLHDSEHNAIITPKPLTPAVEGGFTMDETSPSTKPPARSPAPTTSPARSPRNAPWCPT